MSARSGSVQIGPFPSTDGIAHPLLALIHLQ